MPELCVAAIYIELVSVVSFFPTIFPQSVNINVLKYHSLKIEHLVSCHHNAGHQSVSETGTYNQHVFYNEVKALYPPAVFLHCLTLLSVLRGTQIHQAHHIVFQTDSHSVLW